MENSSSSAFQQYLNVWVGTKEEVSEAKEIGSGASDGASTSAETTNEELLIARQTVP
jgi:hypothetical protein